MEADDRKDRVFDELAVVGKAFGSAKRLELVDLLAQGERTVEGLARAAGMGVSTVSAHLQVLKLANLVLTRREGTKVHYRLAGDDVALLYAAMRSVARERSADVGRALDAYLNIPGADEVGLVTREELEELLSAGEITLLDVRPPEEFLAGHIPGARNAPLGSLASEADGLRHAPSVVAYCRGSFCVMAHDAVRLLGGEGVQARRLEDGMLEWRTAGLPVSVGAA
jgi:rhodanese-related sulfurtransferase/DNA-binding transcriptional ArsR family regulator